MHVKVGTTTAGIAYVALEETHQDSTAEDMTDQIGRGSLRLCHAWVGVSNVILHVSHRCGDTTVATQNNLFPMSSV